MSSFVATSPEAYQAYVGRCSQNLAPAFVRFAGVSATEQVLDVGCGTGNLTRAIANAKAVARGIDLSVPYLEFARRITVDEAVTFEEGDALDLPYSDGFFKRSLSMLALDVLPDSLQGLKEMVRVTRPGGTVAVLVNNFRSGWTPFSLIWDAAAVLDPEGRAMRDEMVSKPLSWPGGLAQLFATVSLINIVEEQVSTILGYQSFEDYWSGFLTGQGRTGSYVTNLGNAQRRDLEKHVRAAYLCGMEDGPRNFVTLMWAVRGEVCIVPGATLPT